MLINFQKNTLGVSLGTKVRGFNLNMYNISQIIYEWTCLAPRASGLRRQQQFGVETVVRPE
jgi:hypothetical protein